MPRPPADRLRHWPGVALALVAGAIAVWARHRIFPNLSWNRDEPVYLWQVDVLRSGHLVAPDGGHPDLFLPWLSAGRDGGLFTQYTLGWPIVLLVSEVLTGSPTAALGAGAALAVLGTYAFAWELTRERAIAIGAALVMVASPLLPIQGGVHLSYLFTLGLGLLFGAGLLSGIRTGRLWRAGAGGALLGYVLLTRPYDAVLWGLAFAAYAAVLHRERRQVLVRPFLVGALAGLPFVVLTLLYNRHVTGALLDFPIVAVDPLDTFGFGDRRLMPEFPRVDYTPGSALYSTAKHLFFVPWFLAGSYLGVVLGGVGLWEDRRRVGTLALLLVGAVFPLGYLPFWGTKVSADFTRLTGPLYYVPLFACLAVLIATAVVRLRRRHAGAAVVLVAALVLATVPTARSRLMINHELSAAQAAWPASVESIDGRALVFVGDAAHYLLYANPFSANRPELDGRILYAVDGDPEMLDLIAEQPDRTPYVQLATVGVEDRGPREDPLPYDVHLVPVEVVRSAGFTLDLGAVDAGSAAVTSVEVRLGGNVLTRTMPAGDPLPSLTLGPRGTGDWDLTLPARGTLSVRIGFGEDEEDALDRPAGREDILFRVVDGEVEVLLPTAKLAPVTVGSTWQWRRQVALSAPAVELTPVAAR